MNADARDLMVASNHGAYFCQAFLGEHCFICVLICFDCVIGVLVVLITVTLVSLGKSLR